MARSRAMKAKENDRAKEQKTGGGVSFFLMFRCLYSGCGMRERDVRVRSESKTGQPQRYGGGWCGWLKLVERC